MVKHKTATTKMITKTKTPLLAKTSRGISLKKGDGELVAWAEQRAKHNHYSFSTYVMLLIARDRELDILRMQGANPEGFGQPEPETEVKTPVRNGKSHKR